MTRFDDVVRGLESGRANRISLGLARTHELLRRLGNPHVGLNGVLVAGTNGKGSVCATLDAVSRAAVRRTVTMVKPHLESWTERILIDGCPITEAKFADLATRVEAAAEQWNEEAGPTTFELLTVMGFMAAQEHRAETLVCEVGLGGRLDSTNVADLGVAVITNISRDHMEFLGDTVEQIAAEKAAIIKPGNQVVTAATGVALEVIRQRARSQDSHLTVLGNDVAWGGNATGRDGVQVWIEDRDGRIEATSPLMGRVQCENLALAMVSARRMGFTEAEIRQGASRTEWRGRLQWMEDRPPVLLDGAHNEAAMRALEHAVPELAKGREVVAVFGAMADKSLEPMLQSLRRITDRVVFTSVGSSRSAPANELAAEFGRGVVAADTATALDEARRLAGPGGMVLVTGSLALVGDALRLLDGHGDTKKLGT